MPPPSASHRTASALFRHDTLTLMSSTLRAGPTLTGGRRLSWLHNDFRPRQHGAFPSQFSGHLARPRPHPHLIEFVRGKKTRSTLKLSDLPQGAIPPLEVQPGGAEDAGPAYPTVILQARRNMQKFDNCVLLTRVGGFYELYFEHADEYGPLLHLKVAQKKTSAGPVPMVTSIPLSSLCAHPPSSKSSFLPISPFFYYFFRSYPTHPNSLPLPMIMHSYFPMNLYPSRFS